MTPASKRQYKQRGGPLTTTARASHASCDDDPRKYTWHAHMGVTKVPPSRSD